MAKVKKGAKKKFFEVTIPLTATKVQLYGYSEEEFAGKTVNLDLTRNLRGKSLELKSKVTLNNGELGAEPAGLSLAQSYVRRMMRKGADYIEDSFETECKNGKLRVKLFMIARKKVSRAIKNEIRNMAKKHIISYVKIRESQELFSEVMSNKIQREVSLKSKKIYPLALCEIRSIELIPERKIEQAPSQ